MNNLMNLVPAPRLAARQQRIWRGRGVITCAAYAAVVAAVTLAARTVIGKSSEDVPGMLEAAQSDIDRVNQTLTRVKTDLDATESLLRSSRAIAEQPDWSQLLALLASRGDGQVVLKAVAMRPKDPPAAPAAGAKPANGNAANKAPAPPPEPAILVSIVGAAQSQAAASKFALRLESTGLFRKVSLLDTSRETFADLPLVSFRLECTLAGPTDKMPSTDKLAAEESSQQEQSPKARDEATSVQRKIGKSTASAADLRKPAAEGDEQ